MVQRFKKLKKLEKNPRPRCPKSQAGVALNGARTGGSDFQKPPLKSRGSQKAQARFFKRWCRVLPSVPLSLGVSYLVRKAL